MTTRQLDSRVFLEGPAGTGKTTYAVEYMRGLLSDGIPAESVLVLVPQRTVGRVYQLALHDPTAPLGGDVTVVTLSGLARRSLERFWPLVAGPAGFDPAREPIFLTVETAQYYMMRFARTAMEEGVFDAVSVTPPRLVTQLLDNMAKAATAGFPLEEVADRLVDAWGDRHSSRPPVYRASVQLAQEFRAFCLEKGLLDYALQLEVFMGVLLHQPIFQQDFATRYHHLIVDNLEETGPLVHDFIQFWWEHWQSALLVYDSDGGYRTFLGADPDNAVGLANLCDERIFWEERPATASPEMASLEREVQLILSPNYRDLPPLEPDPLAVIHYENHTYYPQMIDWVARQVIRLVEEGVPPREIVILAPFLSDSLRFSLRSRLDSAGIPTLSHRPSRALRDEPAARAMLTLLALGHPQWEMLPPPSDVTDLLTQVIGGLDPVRAKLLTDIVYKQRHGELGTFERIQPAVRDRITYVAGEHYEQLRAWLSEARVETARGAWPIDYFLSRVFGEILSQPGFGFYGDLESGRIVAQLIESARKFRQVLYPDGLDDWNVMGREYFQLVNEGLLAALYTLSWRDEEADAVLMAPAYTFLMRNRFVDYQFWLDVGSQSWWERLDQPLTHPYVLKRHYPKGAVWTENDEVEAQSDLLYRLVVGLVRRCRRGIYLGISDLGEQGYEQRGPLLFLFQQILQRRKETGDDGK